MYCISILEVLIRMNKERVQCCYRPSNCLYCETSRQCSLLHRHERKNRKFTPGINLKSSACSQCIIESRYIICWYFHASYFKTMFDLSMFNQVMSHSSTIGLRSPSLQGDLVLFIQIMWKPFDQPRSRCRSDENKRVKHI